MGGYPPESECQEVRRGGKKEREREEEEREFLRSLVPSYLISSISSSWTDTGVALCKQTITRDHMKVG